jgi:ribonuclease D
MNHDVTFLHELWDSMKHFVPKKDKLQTAEAIVRSFDDHADIGDIEDSLNEFDGLMKAALVSHFEISSHNEDDDDETDGDW